MNTSIITYGFYTSPFGSVCVGLLQTSLQEKVSKKIDEKVCFISFSKILDEKKIKNILSKKWKGSELARNDKKISQVAAKIFSRKDKKVPVLIAFSGTDFQIQVWKKLMSIPSGAVKTYKELAKAIGKPNAVRAVGAACGKNDIAYLVPCHRVIGSNGKLTGYKWGLPLKKALLQKEQE